MELIDFADFIGILGVGCVLGAYFLLQSSFLQVKDLRYSVMNAIGAVLIMYSLLFHWNTASVVIEIFWFAISIYGGIRTWIQKKT